MPIPARVYPNRGWTGFSFQCPHALDLMIIMAAPWRELKGAEVSMLVKRRNGETQSDLEWQRLRDLFDRCRADDDAEEAICFHGVAALLAEREADYELALEHRMIEIDKINWLHQEEARNPTDGFQTQNYESVDLELRHEIVRDLKRRQ